MYHDLPSLQSCKRKRKKVNCKWKWKIVKWGFCFIGPTLELFSFLKERTTLSDPSGVTNATVSAIEILAYYESQYKYLIGESHNQDRGILCCLVVFQYFTIARGETQDRWCPRRLEEIKWWDFRDQKKRSPSGFLELNLRPRF